MRNKQILFTALLALLLIPCSAADRDSLISRNTWAKFTTASEDGNLEDYLQYGIHIGTDVNLTDKWLSERDHMKTHLAAMFGAYVRGGYKFIFAETGLEYIFHKCQYETWNAEGFRAGAETVESRYLQVPVKVVGLIKAGKIFSFLPYAGIVYKPLIHCSKNDIGYGKATLTRHQCQVTAGLDLRIKFVMVGVGYRYNLLPAFSDRKSIRQQFLSITLGVQL